MILGKGFGLIGLISEMILNHMKINIYNQRGINTEKNNLNFLYF